MCKINKQRTNTSVVVYSAVKEWLSKQSSEAYLYFRIPLASYLSLASFMTRDRKSGVLGKSVQRPGDLRGGPEI